MTSSAGKWENDGVVTVAVPARRCCSRMVPAVANRATNHPRQSARQAVRCERIETARQGLQPSPRLTETRLMQPGRSG